MNILYIGDTNPNSTSYHRSQALVRLGHNVTLADPYRFLGNLLSNPIISKINYETGYTLVQPKINKWIRNTITSTINIDIIWINSGELLGPGAIKRLKRLNKPVVLYNNDDPTGTRDRNRFKQLKKALYLYDLCAVVREPTYQDFLKLNIRKVIKVWMSYDEKAHQATLDKSKIPEQYVSDVAFIGTWMRNESRDIFILELLKNNINVSIWGDRWEKSTYWPLLKKHHKGGALGGNNYVYAIQGAKVVLGLLSKGNRDLHTQRSMEVPYAGGLLCAERTAEHQMLFTEGVEAVFWNDATECASICIELLQNDSKREEIRKNGNNKIKALEVGNEDICKYILNQFKEKW